MRNDRPGVGSECLRGREDGKYMIQIDYKHYSQKNAQLSTIDSRVETGMPSVNSVISS
jgi:hypothetical protein